MYSAPSLAAARMIRHTELRNRAIQLLRVISYYSAMGCKEDEINEALDEAHAVLSEMDRLWH